MPLTRNLPDIHDPVIIHNDEATRDSFRWSNGEYVTMAGPSVWDVRLGVLLTLEDVIEDLQGYYRDQCEEVAERVLSNAIAGADHPRNWDDMVIFRRGRVLAVLYPDPSGEPRYIVTRFTDGRPVLESQPPTQETQLMATKTTTKTTADEADALVAEAVAPRPAARKLAADGRRLLRRYLKAKAAEDHALARLEAAREAHGGLLPGPDLRTNPNLPPAERAAALLAASHPAERRHVAAVEARFEVQRRLEELVGVAHGIESGTIDWSAYEPEDFPEGFFPVAVRIDGHLLILSTPYEPEMVEFTLLPLGAVVDLDA